MFVQLVGQIVNVSLIARCIDKIDGGAEVHYEGGSFMLKKDDAEKLKEAMLHHCKPVEARLGKVEAE